MLVSSRLWQVNTHLKAIVERQCHVAKPILRISYKGQEFFVPFRTRYGVVRQYHSTMSKTWQDRFQSREDHWCPDWQF